MKRNNIGRRRSFPTVVSPRLHESPALLEHIAAPVRLLNLIADDMRKRRLDNLILERGALTRPGFERGAEANRRNISGC
jgi:hypothetical protein